MHLIIKDIFCFVYIFFISMMKLPVVHYSYPIMLILVLGFGRKDDPLATVQEIIAQHHFSLKKFYILV